MNAAAALVSKTKRIINCLGCLLQAFFFFKDNDCQLRRQLLTIIYNKNTARCAYKNNQKSSDYLLFLPK